MQVSVISSIDGSLEIHTDDHVIHVGGTQAGAGSTPRQDPGTQPPAAPNPPTDPRRPRRPIIVGPRPGPRPATSIVIVPVIPGPRRDEQNPASWLDLRTDLDDDVLGLDAVARLREAARALPRGQALNVSVVLQPELTVDVDSLAHHLQAAIGGTRPLNLQLGGRLEEE